ncbi:MAG: hypothetical protein EXS32_09195 [Opitutus sp.]|nr:hypothetical protein [Opitutus sp.]
MLSAYDTPLYNEMLLAKNGWKRVVIKTHTRDTTGKDFVREEVLWQNWHFVNAAKAKRVPIQLTKAEKSKNPRGKPRGI